MQGPRNGLTPSITHCLVIYILQLHSLVVLKLPSWPSKHLCATCCGLVTDIAISLHANITVSLVANFIAVGLLANTTVGLHANITVGLVAELQSGFLPTPQLVFMPLMDFHSSALLLVLFMFVFGWSCCQLHCSWASC